MLMCETFNSITYYQNTNGMIVAMRYINFAKYIIIKIYFDSKKIYQQNMYIKQLKALYIVSSKFILILNR